MPLTTWATCLWFESFRGAATSGSFDIYIPLRAACDLVTMIRPTSTPRSHSLVCVACIKHVHRKQFTWPPVALDKDNGRYFRHYLRVLLRLSTAVSNNLTSAVVELQCFDRFWHVTTWSCIILANFGKHTSILIPRGWHWFHHVLMGALSCVTDSVPCAVHALYCKAVD